MKTIVVTVEIKIDEKSIVRKYPNFGLNYQLRPDSQPTAKGMIDFARSHIEQERAMRDFGFSSRIINTKFK